MRQCERMSVVDHAIEERALAFHVGEEPPQVPHYVAQRPPAELPYGFRASLKRGRREKAGERGLGTGEAAREG